MSSDAETQAAIDKLNESELDGRNIIVNVARPREERAPTRGNDRSSNSQPANRGRGSGGRRY
jgi:RNA recognition motif-containing protein